MDPAIVAVETGLRGKTGVRIKMLEIFGSKLPHLYARDHPQACRSEGREHHLTLSRNNFETRVQRRF